MRAAAAALVFSLAAGASLAAQDARLAERLEPPVLAGVSRVVDSVRAVGLPTEPLVDKALEGASKRASGDRILTAVRGLAADLGAARAALGRRAGQSELIAGAAALRAGASRNDLSRLRSEREGTLTVPLAVLANLMARGVPSDTASAVVISLAARGAPDAEFTELQREIERDIGTGASPAAAASVRGKGRGEGSNPEAGRPGNPGRGRGAPGADNPGRAGNPGRPPEVGPPADRGRGNPNRGNPGRANPGRGNPDRGNPRPGNPNPRPSNTSSPRLQLPS